MNKVLLHIEGFTVFALCLYVYWFFGFSWWLFLLFILAPDLSMVGYIVNPHTGAFIYNIFHTYTFSFFIIFIGWLFSIPLLATLGLIWTAHIGMDRMVGYGLKYPTNFKHNHLNQMRIVKDTKDSIHSSKLS